MHDYNFKEIILKEKIISAAELNKLAQRYNDNDLDLIVHLIDEGKVKREYLGKLCGDSLGIAYAELKKVIFEQDLIEKIPEYLAKTFKIIPIYQFAGIVTIVTSDPKNLFILNEIEKLLKCQVSALFSFPDEIDEAIQKYYPEKANSQASYQESKLRQTIEKTAEKRAETEIYKASQESPIFSESSQKFLINNSREMIDAAFNGEIPKRMTTERVSNLILEEIDTKLNLISGFHQLRINDEYTYSHCLNVAALTALFTKLLGFRISEIKELTLAALLHDIGKMRVPKEILYKSGKLTPQEIAIAKTHPQLGYQIVEQMGLSKNIANIVFNHHERINGQGYPRRLKGDAVTTDTQIIAIPDVYDDLVSNKPYEGGIGHHEALNIMLLEGQHHFNYDLVKEFVGIAYKQSYDDLKYRFKTSVYGELV